ncbi:unnamed protein product [Closterium sp. Yama58-4]|nr:unnamed protein product [Closterium sp. Yama58-4]
MAGRSSRSSAFPSSASTSSASPAFPPSVSVSDLPRPEPARATARDDPLFSAVPPCPMLYAVLPPASDPLPPLPSAHARESSPASSARNAHGAAEVGGAAHGRRGTHARAKSWDVGAGAEGGVEGGRAADAGSGAALPRLVPAMMTSLSLTVECLMTTASVSIQGMWEVGEYAGGRAQGGGGGGGGDGGGDGGANGAGDGGGKGEEQQQCCDCLFVLPTSHRVGAWGDCELPSMSEMSHVTAVEVTLADGRFLATAVLPADEAEAACRASQERAAAALSAAQPVPPRPARPSFLRLSSASFSRSGPSGSSRHRWKSQGGVGDGDGRAEASREGEWGESSRREGGVSGGMERGEGGGERGEGGGESERRKGGDDEDEEGEQVEGSGGQRQRCVARRHAAVLLDESPMQTPHMLRLRIPKGSSVLVHATYVEAMAGPNPHGYNGMSFLSHPSSHPSPAPPLPHTGTTEQQCACAGDIHGGDGGAAGEQRDERAADVALKVPPPLCLSLPSSPTQVPQGSSVRVRATYMEAMAGRQGYSEMSVPLTVPLECVPIDLAVQEVVRVSCTINSGLQCPMKIGDFNHPMKVVLVELGRATFVGHPSDDDPDAWPNADFTISFQVVTEDVSAAVLVQAPLIGDPDPRASFALSIAPPDPSQFSVCLDPLPAHVSSCSCLFLLVSLPARVSSCSCLFLLVSLPARVSSCSCLFLLVSLPARVSSCSCLFLLVSLPARISSCSCLFLTFLFFPFSTHFSSTVLAWLLFPCPCVPSFVAPELSRAVVFILDSECGLRGRPMEDAHRAVAAALRRLKPHDSFAVVAFDFELLLLDDELEAASPEAVRRACKFVLQAHDWPQPTNVLTPLQLAASPEAVRHACKFVLQAHDWPQPTNVLTPLQLVGGWRAVQLGGEWVLRGHTAALQQIVLITDGPVRAERRVCQWVQRALADWGGTAPRISTFGIGPSVNPFFLKWLAAATRGSSQVTRNPAEVRRRLDGMLQAMARPLVTNIAIRDLPPACELYPYPIPDLYASGPVVVSGRMGDEGSAAGGAEGGGGLPLHVELRVIEPSLLQLSSISLHCQPFSTSSSLCTPPHPFAPRCTVVTVGTTPGGGGRAGGHPHSRCMAAQRPTPAAGGMRHECGSVSGIRAHAHAAARHLPPPAGPAAHRSAAGAAHMGAEGSVHVARDSWVLIGACWAI